MNTISIQRVLAWLLPFVLVACATTGGAQSGPSREERAARLANAEAMFDQRCKTAGEKIHRTVDNVEGIFLMKLRPEGINRGNQFAMDDPYGSDSGGEAYLKGFFLESHLFANRFANAEMTAYIRAHYSGYHYVEAIDPKDGKRYRYTGAIKSVGKKDVSAPNVQINMKRDPNYDLNIYAFVLDKTPVSGPPPRYGVTYEDISTREEREYWIAGSSLKVIDLKTNEVIAERIGYMMDRGQGNDSGGRGPWLMAASNACPRFESEKPALQGLPGFSQQHGQTRRFVVKVLKPILEK